MKLSYSLITTITILLLSFIFQNGLCQKSSENDCIYSGVPWFDEDGNTVSAHGAGITIDNGRYYLFGEFKSDTTIAFKGFSCYSSKDLYNWKFERIVLPVQDSGRLGPNRIGERPKVLRCPKTGEYVMYMHTDDLRYKDQCVGYATCSTINGEYTFQGPLLFNGKAIRKWDMGMFQDTDGSGYLITHSGNLYRLGDDYKKLTEHVVKNMTGQCESPHIFKKEGIYFWLGSGLTSWERNDNYYFTATSIEGPWTPKGNFAPKGSLTWNSQTTFVLPVMGSRDTTFMFMGDRWAFPIQRSAATYVWQPITVAKDSIFLPEYNERWQINASTGAWSANQLQGTIIESTDIKQIQYSEDWVHSAPSEPFSYAHSDMTGASFSFSFKGSQIGLYGFAHPEGGYARVEIQDDNGNKIQSTLIEMYCKYPESSLKFLSSVFPEGSYKLIVTVLGKHGNWYKKDGTKFGSNGNAISIDKIVLRK